jgi:NAD(P)-dependent dehydrogenase (short-subunit alcohol dehydrogenase family)
LTIFEFRSESTQARIGNACVCRDTITKAAMEMLVRQLAPDLLPLGIKIHAVDPGPTNTGWMTPDVLAQVRAASPRGEVNTPEDAADLVLSILAGDNRDSGTVVFAPR